MRTALPLYNLDQTFTLRPSSRRVICLIGQKPPSTSRNACRKITHKLCDAFGTVRVNNDFEMLKRIYDCFNARDIDCVLGALADDVAWANGMDGGHVHGREGVREYWTRQWAIVSPHVEPMNFGMAANGSILVEVRQSVRDLQGRPLQDQTHGLRDKTVVHVFRLREGKVTRFDIQDAS